MGRIPPGGLAAALAALYLTAAYGQSPAGEEALALAKKAQRAERAGRNADAYLAYSEAAALQPRNQKYRAKMLSLQTRAGLEGRATPAVASGPASAAETAPEEVFSSLTARELSLAREMLPVPSLAARPGKQDFSLSGTARILFDKIATQFGLDTVYDGDYPTAGPTLRFEVKDADYREALHYLEAATSSFVVPLSGRVFMVAQDTPQKRNDLEQSIAISIPVPESLTTQELTELSQAVKQVTNVEKIAVDTAQNTVIIRDRVSRALPAQALLRQLFSYRGEVMIDVEFLEVADSDILKYGFNVTTDVPGVFLGQILRNAVTAPAGVANLVTFGAGKTLIGLGVAQAQALFNESTSSVRSMFRAQVRSLDGQPATFHAGEKYPVVTASYVGSAAPGQTASYLPPPSYTFEDLGVLVKVTPHIHGAGEMTLAVETSFELLTGSSVGSIPVIGRRQFNTQVRLREGEWAVVAGLMNTTDSKAQSGFWGLDQIPLLGNLFKQTSKDKESTSVLVAIRPHVISLPPDEIVSHPLRVGSETRPFSPL